MKSFKILAVAAMAAMTAMSVVGCNDEKGNEGGSPIKPDPIGQVDKNGVWIGKDLRGKLEQDTKLDPTVKYELSKELIVPEGKSLTIPAGTQIMGTVGFYSYILVDRGAKIFIQGTKDKPVKMFAENEALAWGGLIVNGKAPISETKKDGAMLTEWTTEINTAYKYGGNDPKDNSGEITYLELAWGGSKNNAEVEHNGLTLNAVGDGTKVENVYIHDCVDDGIEFFGGTVNVKNLLIVNAHDDMIDFTQGYTGVVENAYCVRNNRYWAVGDPCGIEADGNLDGNTPDAKNQTKFNVKNITIVFNQPDAKDDPGFNDKLSAIENDKDGKNREVLYKSQLQSVFKVRRGATANIENALVEGNGFVLQFNDFCDKKAAGTKESKISVTNNLTAPEGKKNPKTEFIAGYRDKSNVWIYAPATDYPNVKIEKGNKGCDKAEFGWTKVSL